MLVKYLDEPDKDGNSSLYGISLVGAYIAVYLIQALAWEHSTYIQNLIVVNVDTSILYMIHEKLLKINMGDTTKFSEGQLNTFLTTDVDTVKDMVGEMNIIARYPVEFAFSLFFLYEIFGWVFLWSILIGTLIGIVRIFLALCRAATKKRLQTKRDRRMEPTKEMINNSVFVKLNLMETYFMKKIMNARATEVLTLKIYTFLGKRV